MTKPNFPFEACASRPLDRTSCGCVAAHQTEEIPIACDLTVFTAAERAAHLARTEALFAAVHMVTEQADGFTFSFAATPARRAEIGHWGEAERRCCPFFRFELRNADAGRTLLLRISGPVAGKEILRAAMHTHGIAVGTR